MEGKANEDTASLVLCASIRLDPFEAMGSGELGFLWIAEILNSRYQEGRREWMASQVMESIGKHFVPRDSVASISIQPTWISSLLGLLSLREKFDRQGKHSLAALRILATSPPSTDFGTMVLPILVSPLLPTHPLQPRRIALQVFDTFAPGWFSSQMKSVPSKDLNKLVQAVGDPFQSPDFPLKDGKPVDLNPTMITTVLIGFASSDLWRNHLRRSNFTSFEEIVSTWDGKKAALKCMAHCKPPESLFTATGIIMAIRRLEELQCLNTAEVVIMWAWTIGVVNPVDLEGWQLIERDTLRFYETHGTGHPIALKRHIADRTPDLSCFKLLVTRYGKEYRVREFLELSVLKLELYPTRRHYAYLHLSRACRLRRLYQLFRYNPTTWKDAVAASEVDEKSDMFLGRSVALSPFMDWACDYP